MRRGGAPRWTIRLLLSLLGGAALILALAQLLLPGIAADRISSRVGRYGKVGNVSVRAWPAVELLWGSAESVSVRAKDLSLSPAQAAKLLWEGRSVERMEVSATSVRIGPVRLTRARLHKHGRSLAAEGLIGSADVKAALPPGFAVRLLASEAGRVRVRASGGLFGVGASVDALAGPVGGRLVVRPLEPALRGLSLTLFSDPHVFVEAVGAVPEPASTPSYRLTMRARLR